jgi:MtN3 and saliva related transmembrane protein
MNFTSLIGIVAACGTTIAYIPQLHKCWTTGKADDLSLRMFLILAIGVALWIVYGILRSDLVIIGANAVSLSCLFGILFFKLRGGAKGGS